jgi:hypothetical protein
VKWIGVVGLLALGVVWLAGKGVSPGAGVGKWG